MMKVFVILILSGVVTGCSSSKQISNSEIVEKERFSLIVQFDSDEDVKRVPFRLSHLKMELIRQVNGAENLYEGSIYCDSSNLDEFIKKLPLEEGITWVKKVE